MTYGADRRTASPEKMAARGSVVTPLNRKVILINDLIANDYGIHALKPEDFFVLNAGHLAKGNAAVIQDLQENAKFVQTLSICL